MVGGGWKEKAEMYGKKVDADTVKGGRGEAASDDAIVNSSRSGMSRVVRHGQNEPYPILSGVAKKLREEG